MNKFVQQPKLSPQFSTAIQNMYHAGQEERKFYQDYMKEKNITEKLPISDRVFSDLAFMSPDWSPDLPADKRKEMAFGRFDALYKNDPMELKEKLKPGLNAYEEFDVTHLNLSCLQESGDDTLKDGRDTGGLTQSEKDTLQFIRMTRVDTAVGDLSVKYPETMDLYYDDTKQHEMEGFQNGQIFRSMGGSYILTNVFRSNQLKSTGTKSEDIQYNPGSDPADFAQSKMELGIGLAKKTVQPLDSKTASEPVEFHLTSPYTDEAKAKDRDGVLENSNLTHFDQIFDSLNNTAQRLNMEITDLVYIDGRPVTDLPGDMNQKKENALKQILSGSHHVDLALPAFDRSHDPAVRVVPLKVNLENDDEAYKKKHYNGFMRFMDRFFHFIDTPSKCQERLFEKKDPKAEAERLDAIRKKAEPRIKEGIPALKAHEVMDRTVKQQQLALDREKKLHEPEIDALQNKKAENLKELDAIENKRLDVLEMDSNVSRLQQAEKKADQFAAKLKETDGLIPAGKLEEMLFERTGSIPGISEEQNNRLVQQIDMAVDAYKRYDQLRQKPDSKVAVPGMDEKKFSQLTQEEKLKLLKEDAVKQTKAITAPLQDALKENRYREFASEAAGNSRREALKELDAEKDACIERRVQLNKEQAVWEAKDVLHDEIGNTTTGFSCSSWETKKSWEKLADIAQIPPAYESDQQKMDGYARAKSLHEIAAFRNDNLQKAEKKKGEELDKIDSVQVDCDFRGNGNMTPEEGKKKAADLLKRLDEVNRDGKFLDQAPVSTREGYQERHAQVERYLAGQPKAGDKDMEDVIPEMCSILHSQAMTKKGEGLEERMVYANGSDASATQQESEKIQNEAAKTEKAMKSYSASEMHQVMLRVAKANEPQAETEKVFRQYEKAYGYGASKGFREERKIESFKNNLDPARDPVQQMREFAAKEFVDQKLKVAANMTQQERGRISEQLASNPNFCRLVGSSPKEIGENMKDPLIVAKVNQAVNPKAAESQKQAPARAPLQKSAVKAPAGMMK